MMTTLERFEAFVQDDRDWNLDIVLREENPDIGGGRIPVERIDVLADRPDADTVTIMGLYQPMFEHFIRTYGRQFRGIRFWKNKGVEDWSLLGTLDDLEFVFYFFNQKIDRLWDMSGNRSMKGLWIDDFSRLKSLEGLRNAPALEILHIGNRVWDKAVLDSLLPLAGTPIRHFSFGGKSIFDTDLSFLLEMPFLETFEGLDRILTTEQAAWAAANRPDVKSRMFQAHSPTWKLDPVTHEFNIPAVHITGKGKPTLAVATQQDRICRYVAEYERLVECYRGVPYQKVFPKP